MQSDQIFGPSAPGSSVSTAAWPYLHTVPDHTTRSSLDEVGRLPVVMILSRLAVQAENTGPVFDRQQLATCEAGSGAVSG